MPIDSMDWHQGEDFPPDLDPRAAGTHIGMFLTWLILNNFINADHEDENSDALEAVHARAITGRAYLIDRCHRVLQDQDVDEDTHAFAIEYYGTRGDDGGSTYLEEYERTLAAGLPSIYHVQDAWDNYDLLAPVLDAAYARWKQKQD